MTQVTVIIPTYNCAEFVTDAVHSVLAQTYKNYEILVIDDGSTDNTRKVLSSYIERCLIKYICQENKGLACARNTGIKNASGDFIALLDADDLWLPYKLEVQMPAFQLSPKIGIVHADRCKFMDSGEFFRPIRENFSDEFIKRHSGDLFEACFLREIFISCPTAVIRKECFDKVGLFDENLAKLGFEDSEMWLRILRHYEAYHVNKAVALYRVRPNSMSKNRKKMIEAHKYLVEKISKQYNLSPELRKRALKAMRKEWGLGEYIHERYMGKIAGNIKNILGLRNNYKKPFKCTDFTEVMEWIERKYSPGY